MLRALTRWGTINKLWKLSYVSTHTKKKKKKKVNIFKNPDSVYAVLNEPAKHWRTKGAEDNTQILSRGVGSERGTRRLGTDSGRHSAGTFALSCYRHYTSTAARCASGPRRQPAGLLSSASSDFSLARPRLCAWNWVWTPAIKTATQINLWAYITRQSKQNVTKEVNKRDTVELESERRLLSCRDAWQQFTMFVITECELLRLQWMRVCKASTDIIIIMMMMIIIIII